MKKCIITLLCGTWAMFMYSPGNGQNGKQPAPVSNLPAGVLRTEVHQSNPNSKKIILNDFVSFHLEIRNQDNEIIKSTFNDQPIVKEISALDTREKYEYSDRGYLHDLLRTLRLGDSVSFYIDADTYFKNIDRAAPPSIQPGSEISFTFKVIKIQSESQALLDREKEVYDQKQKELELFKEYGSSRRYVGIKKAGSGLWTYVLNEGNGRQIERDDILVVHLIGKFLDGTVFADTYAEEKPLEFPAGGGVMIAGIDQGILLLQEGSKAVLMVPSELAYGEKGVEGAIQPNTPLVFEVEILAVKDKMTIDNPQDKYSELIKTEVDPLLTERDKRKTKMPGVEDFDPDQKKDIDKENKKTQDKDPYLKPPKPPKFKKPSYPKGKL